MSISTYSNPLKINKNLRSYFFALQCAISTNQLNHISFNYINPSSDHFCTTLQFQNPKTLIINTKPCNYSPQKTATMQKQHNSVNSTLCAIASSAKVHNPENSDSDIFCSPLQFSATNTLPSPASLRFSSGLIGDKGIKVDVIPWPKNQTPVSDARHNIINHFFPAQYKSNSHSMIRNAFLSSLGIVKK